MRLPNILAIVMAGGDGSRLDVLTEKRAKPSLPFGGTYRLIDVSLSNLAHAHISDVLLVEEYLPHTLNRHLDNGRPWDLDRSHRGLQLTVPYTGAEGEGFHEGNSDTLFSQIPLIEERNPDPASRTTAMTCCPTSLRTTAWPNTSMTATGSTLARPRPTGPHTCTSLREMACDLTTTSGRSGPRSRSCARRR